MNPWEMILTRKYAEAAGSYGAELSKHPDDPGLLSSYAIAMRGLGRLVEALNAFRRANSLASARLNGETQPYLEQIGSTLWLLGRHDEAIQTFTAAVDGIVQGSIKFADNAGGVSQGVLLWYAGLSAPDVKAKTHAIKYLAKLAKKARAKYWPGPLALLVLGLKTSEGVLEEICGTADLDECIRRAGGDLLTRRRLVKTLFYLAACERDKNDERKCHTLMAKCAGIENPVLEVEWYLARAEAAQDLPQKL